MGRDELLQLIAELREQVVMALDEEPNEKIKQRLEAILRLTDGLHDENDNGNGLDEDSIH